MAIKLPEKLKGFALFVDSVGYAGRCTELTLPKLSRKFEEFRAGGMDRPVEIDMGGEKLEADYTLTEYTPAIIEQWGLTTVDGLSTRFKGSVKAEDVDGEEIPIEVVLKGRHRELDMGSWKAGDEATLKVSVAVSDYELIYGGKTLIKISATGQEEVVGGVDRLASRRKNLGA